MRNSVFSRAASTSQGLLTHPLREVLLTRASLLRDFNRPHKIFLHFTSNIAIMEEAISS